MVRYREAGGKCRSRLDNGRMDDESESLDGYYSERERKRDAMRMIREDDRELLDTDPGRCEAMIAGEGLVGGRGEQSGEWHRRCRGRAMLVGDGFCWVHSRRVDWDWADDVADEIDALPEADMASIGRSRGEADG